LVVYGRVGAPVVEIAPVLHTIPLTVTVDPPFEFTFPPPVAVVVVMFVTGVVVVTVGATQLAGAVALKTAEYAELPEEFSALTL
jgi:hypothetical protein